MGVLNASCHIHKCARTGSPGPRRAVHGPPLALGTRRRCSWGARLAAVGSGVANSSANVTINNLTSSTGFPAGHVLQTVTQTASTSSDTTSSAEVPNISGASGSFLYMAMPFDISI